MPAYTYRREREKDYKEIRKLEKEFIDNPNKEYAKKIKFLWNNWRKEKDPTNTYDRSAYRRIRLYNDYLNNRKRKSTVIKEIKNSWKTLYGFKTYEEKKKLASQRELKT